MTIQDYYKHFTEQLKTIYDERESANISDWIFESLANIKRLDRITDKQKQLNNSTIEQLNNALHRLLQHTPVQYILNEAWFYKMKLKVNEHVLIPRPETEELVTWALEEITNNKYKITNNKVEDRADHTAVKENEESPLTTHHSPLTLLDIGTGSGCIAIAFKKQLPEIQVTAIDISEDALLVAKENSGDHNTMITFLKVDFLDMSTWPSLTAFNMIISNPPYIPIAEKDKLEKNVTGHEPHLALFVEDNDPFIFYSKIAEFAQLHLTEGGKVFAEVHEDYASDVKKIFENRNFICEIKKDIYGRERMVKAFKM
jgi:release factor glutamine methyltransferase